MIIVMANPQPTSDDLDSEVSYCRTSDFNHLYYTPISKKKWPKFLFPERWPQYARDNTPSQSSHSNLSSPNFQPSSPIANPGFSLLTYNSVAPRADYHTPSPDKPQPNTSASPDNPSDLEAVVIDYEASIL
jgi:hypothetical protein